MIFLQQYKPNKLKIIKIIKMHQNKDPGEDKEAMLKPSL